MSVLSPEHVYGRSLHERFHEALRNTPWWAISLAVHVLVLILVALYTWEVPLPDDAMSAVVDLKKLPPLPSFVYEPPRPEDRRESPDVRRRNEEVKPEIASRPLPSTDVLIYRPEPGPRPTIVGLPPGPVIPVPLPPNNDPTVPVTPENVIPRITSSDVFRKPCLVVWLFDESRSMKDDQLLIRRKMSDFYDELALLGPDARSRERVRSVVCSFGKDVHVQLREPTSDVERIRAAIDMVPVEDSGIENVLQAVVSVSDEFSAYARRYHRNLVVLVMTDEAGNDDDASKAGADSPLEQALSRLIRMNATVMVFGREAGAFGFAGEQVLDPTAPKGTRAWAWANRGIESAFSEMLPYDGFFRLTQRVPSGFGPYALQRLCRETGGAYFLMRAEGAAAYDYEKLLDGYEPELESRATVASRNASDRFRKGYTAILDAWNRTVQETDLRNTFGVEDRDGRIERSVEAINRRLQVVESGIAWMKAQANVAFKDSPKRWQANRELMWAQLHKERFQLVQYRRALEALAKREGLPPAGDLGWAISWWDHQVLRGDAEELKREMDEVRALYRRVIEHHPQTPWAEFARREMRSLRGLGIVPWTTSRPNEDKPREI